MEFHEPGLYTLIKYFSPLLAVGQIVNEDSPLLFMVLVNSWSHWLLVPSQEYILTLPESNRVEPSEWYPLTVRDFWVWSAISLTVAVEPEEGVVYVLEPTNMLSMYQSHLYEVLWDMPLTVQDGLPEEEEQVANKLPLLNNCIVL